MRAASASFYPRFPDPAPEFSGGSPWGAPPDIRRRDWNADHHRSSAAPLRAIGFAAGSSPGLSGLRTRPRGVAAILLVALLMTLPLVLSAQALRGTLVEEGSRQPIAGSLVQLIAGARDSIVASAVSNERGRFELLRVAPGSYRVRALRIGFRPWVSPPLVLEAGATRDELFAVTPVPVVLAEITVEAKSPCRGSPAEDQRMALLWDEARTALGLVGAGTSDSLEFRTTLTRRLLDPGSHLSQQNSWTSFGKGAWPVSSQPAESLAQLGFVQPRDSMEGPVYFGPDVAVFFSDAFLRTHCFRLVPPAPDAPGLIGLGFEPVKGRKVIDIQGVLWLDRERSGLERLEYQYTGLWAWVPKGSAGGELQFARLASGQPILTGWMVRAPVARVESWPEGARLRDESTRGYFPSGKVVLHGFREEGGRVDDVRSGAGQVLWQAPPDSAAMGRIPSSGEHR